MDILVFQAGFDAHRNGFFKSSCCHAEESPEYEAWMAGWDTRRSYLAKEPLINQIYIDTIGDILRSAYSATAAESLPIELTLLVLELGIAIEVRGLEKTDDA